MLEVLNTEIQNLGLNYEFGKMTKTPVTYPYWVGDYTESPIVTEDGSEESVFIMTGFSRNSFTELETQKGLLKNHFKHGVTAVKDDGTVVSVFYDGSLNIPLEEDDLKKCQVNLSIKIWKGI